MADETRSEMASAGLSLRSRFYGRLPLLLAIGVVFLMLSALSELDPWISLLGYSAVLLLGVFAPDAREAEAPPIVRPTGDTGFAEAVRRLADALPDPCVIVDRRSLVVHVNPAAGIHFPAVVNGVPIAYSMRFPVLIDAIEETRIHGTRTVELHQQVPNETWYKVTVAPLAEDDPENTGVLVITLQSLTEQRRLEALRSDFVANASHELRTPLTSLIGFIDTLVGPAANDKQAREKFLGLMRGQATRMAKLIEDLLSLSRIEMRQHMRPTQPVDIEVLVREVAEGLSPLAADANVEIALDLVAGLEPIRGDRDELYEVVENLVDNAIKYGADGKRVRIALVAAERPGFAAKLTVTDHGPGVAAEHVPRLTERFYRVDADSSRKKRGTGLGLAIVKHIVSRHHGEMAIRSTVGIGTEVDVLFRR
jgi:two-component system phosphate regulon sensor histidine kinase PhoR